MIDWNIYQNILCNELIPKTTYYIENECKKLSLYTWVVLNQLLQRVKLSPGGDVVTATIQLADLIMLDVVAFHIVPVSYGQGKGTWGTQIRGWEDEAIK